MLKYSTALTNDDGGMVSPHHPDLDYTRRALEVSAGSKGAAKMALKRRSGVKKLLTREQRELALKHQDIEQHLPPIGTPTSPMLAAVDRKENVPIGGGIKRKDIRTPYVSHIQRVSDVATPYILHTQITNIDHGNGLHREPSKMSKYSGNVVEYKHDDIARNDRTYSSLQKLPTAGSPNQDRRPRGRHGRKSNSFNEHDLERSMEIKDLTIQSNQMGLYRRAERKQRPEQTRGPKDESFSIRKKIEQFRRWHEEQYREKIKKLKQEVDHQFEAEHKIINRQVGALRETPSSKDMSVTIEEKPRSEVSHEKMEEDKTTPGLSSQPDANKTRSGSARTWKTWRGVNDSYAYNDVKKYITENELMDEEKSSWIKKWILEVNKAMKETHHESIL